MSLNTGTLFGSEIDIDYATATTSLTAPRIHTNYATANTSICSPFFDCLNTVNASCITSCSVSHDSWVYVVGIDADISRKVYFRVPTPDMYIYFRINGSTVATLTGSNTIVEDYPHFYGMDLYNNDLYKVSNVFCGNFIAGHSVLSTNASFLMLVSQIVVLLIFMQILL